MDHVRRLVLEERGDLVGPRDVELDEPDPAALLGLEQRRDAAVVRGVVRRDDLDALADELPQHPGADAAVGAGDEEALAHAATTGFESGGAPSTAISDDVAVLQRDAGSRK